MRYLEILKLLETYGGQTCIITYLLWTEVRGGPKDYKKQTVPHPARAKLDAVPDNINGG